jgi:transposase
MDAREQRGLIIAAMVKLNRTKDGWLVPSQTCAKVYTVDPVAGKCTCPDHQEWGHKCKHLYAVEITIKREISEDGTVTETKSITFTEKRKYSQNWEAYNEAQRTEKSRFQVLLHELCQGVQEPAVKPGKRGVKPHTYKDSVFAMVWKVYTGFSTRRSSTDMAEAHEKGYTSKLIPGAKVCQFHENPVFTEILQGLIVQSSLPLRAVETQFAIDSSGFSGCRFDRWFIEKHGGEKVQKSEHTWVKAHVCCGTKTQIVCAAVVLEKNSADCLQFAGLTKTTTQGGAIGEMSADKAYLSAENVEAIVAAGGVPFIAPKTNTTGGIGGLFEKMIHYFKYRRDEFMQHYHRRSNIETCFSMVKRKFGDSCRSKTDTAMANETLCKILAHNLCCLIQEQHELGIDPIFWQDGAEAAIESVTEETESDCYELVPIAN